MSVDDFLNAGFMDEDNEVGKSTIEFMRAY